MILEKLRNTFEQIGDVIRRFFRLRVSATDNTPVNGSKPLDQGQSPKSDQNPPGVEPSNPESSTSSKNPESPNSDNGIPDENIPSLEGQGETPGPPPSRPGKRKKHDTQKPPQPKRPSSEEKPELICQETHDRQWQIFLRVPRSKKFEVSQNGAELSVSDNGDICQRILRKGFIGQISIIAIAVKKLNYLAITCR